MNRVVVTGLGFITSIGNSKAEVLASLRSGRSGIEIHPELDRPEIPVKLEMARQVYECALHADALGKRLGELRSQAQVSRPPNEAFVTFISAIEDKEPAVAICGHIHEDGGEEDRLGSTRLYNVGPAGTFIDV